jgi:hypothetical protein
MFIEAVYKDMLDERAAQTPAKTPAPATTPKGAGRGR